MPDCWRICEPVVLCLTHQVCSPSALEILLLRHFPLDDPNLEKYDSNSGHRVTGAMERPEPTAIQRSNTGRSKSYSGKGSAEENNISSYEQTLGDIRRLRSTRMEKQLGSTTKRARTSQIIGGPQGISARPGSSGNEMSTTPKPVRSSIHAHPLMLKPEQSNCCLS